MFLSNMGYHTYIRAVLSNMGSLSNMGISDTHVGQDLEGRHHLPNNKKQIHIMYAYFLLFCQFRSDVACCSLLCNVVLRLAGDLCLAIAKGFLL